MMGIIVVGTAGTFIGKYLDLTKSPKNDPQFPDRCYYFTHPYLQTTFMFIGEFSCFGLLYLKL
jgi:hypothetical protein